MANLYKLFILLLILSPIKNLYAQSWVHDAFMKDKITFRIGYETLFQPEHNQRIFESIHTIQADFEKHWKEVRLFVTNMGYHFGFSNSQGNPSYWDDLRFGAQYQFKELKFLFGGVRFWTKLPNTRDETYLGTDETDFSIIAIQSLKTPNSSFSIHFNIGLGITGAPELMQSQNDFLLAGIRFDWWILPYLPLHLTIHGFSGFKKNDDKISVMLTAGHTSEWWAIYIDLQAPLSSNFRDYADPLDHTAWGGKIYGVFTF